MLYFTPVYYVYLKYNEEQPKNHHKYFVLKQKPHFTITSPLIILENIEIVGKNICKKCLFFG